MPTTACRRSPDARPRSWSWCTSAADDSVWRTNLRPEQLRSGFACAIHMDQRPVPIRPAGRGVVDTMIAATPWWAK